MTAETTRATKGVVDFFDRVNGEIVQVSYHEEGCGPKSGWWFQLDKSEINPRVLKAAKSVVGGDVVVTSDHYNNVVKADVKPVGAKRRMYLFRSPNFTS
jgi:hypothetical protein